MAPKGIGPPWYLKAPIQQKALHSRHGLKEQPGRSHDLMIQLLSWYFGLRRFGGVPRVVAHFPVKRSGGSNPNPNHKFKAPIQGFLNECFQYSQNTGDSRHKSGLDHPYHTAYFHNLLSPYGPSK